MNNCAILSIGSELLEGSIVDTNSVFLASKLSSLGIKPHKIEKLPDDKQTILKAFKTATELYPLVFTTGGLGPTFDDITAECSAEFASTSLEFSETAYSHMVEVLNKVGIKIRDSHKRQAMLPKDAILFKNYSGTAYGFGVKVNNSIIISMPGVPSEMMGMFEKAITPFLVENNYSADNYNKIITFANLPESDIDREILDIGIPKDVECIINAGKGIVKVKLRSSESKNVDEFANKLVTKFKRNFIGFDESTIVSVLVEKLKASGKTLAVAESCTGGLISKTVTDEAGISSVFLGGVTSYANEVKIDTLKVRKETIETFGAVSCNVAKLMSDGVVRLMSSDFGISTTGIAGPGGATKDKPVGTVFIGFGRVGDMETKHLKLNGTREDIRLRATNIALFSLLDYINIRGL